MNAIKKHNPMIDLHQDLLCHIHRRDFFPKDHWQTNFEMIRNNELSLVVSTAFPVPPEENYFDPVSNEIIEQEFLTYAKKTQSDPNWILIKTAADVDRVLQPHAPTGLLLHIEGLNVIDAHSWERLERWYEIGWRSLGIVWNLTNPLGGGTKDSISGLTSLGSQVIDWCQSKRMVIDMAHMNETTFWDVVRHVEQPIYISHGNCRSLCNNPRNYSDEQLRAVAKSGGVIGVFFAKTYVTGKELPGSIDHLIDHLDHLYKTIGEDHIAFGTDFGGIISGFIEGLDTLDKLPLLMDALREHGYHERILEKWRYQNAARVLKAFL